MRIYLKNLAFSNQYRISTYNRNYILTIPVIQSCSAVSGAGAPAVFIANMHAVWLSGG
jgi:hypothetical protein